jgi:hypothetical protein
MEPFRRFSMLTTAAPHGMERQSKESNLQGVPS